VIVHADLNPRSNNELHRLDGTVVAGINDDFLIEWGTLQSTAKPRMPDRGVYVSYVGATLTARAFDAMVPDLGKWLVTISVWLFAISTMIAWSYYGEQSMIFLLGQRSVLAYKIAFCALIIVATLGFIQTDAELDNLTGAGTGVMLFANVPIMLIFGSQAMRAYRDYIRRLESGRMGPGHKPPSLEDLISGKDVE